MAKKARKWSNVNVPEEPVALTEREIAVRAEADKLRGVGTDPEGHAYTKKDMRELAQDYNGLCEEEEFEKLAARDRSVKYEALERVIRDELIKVEELSGQDMWRGEGCTLSPKNTLIAVVVDKITFKKWIRDTEQEHILEVPPSRLTSIVTDAMDPDAAALLTPAERALLKPGEPASGQPPPGVTIFIRKGINHR